ncbi:MAG: GatB/YqeY domain-containing protein [Candidatus Omnitrophica bacterium]|nr:GatB/YqeY domain-containing protein [Candidatus Omnitrophota bacterium]
MTLEEKLNHDYREALKNKEPLKVSTLRLLKSALQYTLINTKKEQLSDEDITQVIRKQAMQRKDSIESYEKGGRVELMKQEEDELHILESYLPQQLSDEDLLKITKEAIAEIGASSKKEMGTVIKEIKERTKGGADGKRISKLVSSLLN